MTINWNLIIVFPIMCFIGYLYCKNFYHAIRAVNTKNKSFITFIRFFGIFFPVFGVIMGLIKEPEYTNI